MGFILNNLLPLSIATLRQNTASRLSGNCKNPMWT